MGVSGDTEAHGQDTGSREGKDRGSVHHRMQLSSEGVVRGKKAGQQTCAKDDAPL